MPSAFDRLGQQHKLLTVACDGHLIHPDITLPSDAHVLESATGSGIWLTEVAEAHPDFKLSGMDISSAQFPSTYDSDRINFSTHDITKPLPDSLKGKFDLVHQRLVVAGIKAENWPAVIGHLVEGLKPGGSIQILESLLRLKLEGGKTDPVLDTMNEVFAAGAKLGGQDLLVTLRMEELMRAAGLQDIRVIPELSPTKLPQDIPGKEHLSLTSRVC